MLTYTPPKNDMCSEKLYHVIVPEIATLTEMDLRFYPVTHGSNREHIRKHVKLSILAMVAMYNDGHAISAISSDEAIRIYNDIQTLLHTKYSPDSGINSSKGSYSFEVEAMDRFSKEIHSNNNLSVTKAQKVIQNINPFDPLQGIVPEISTPGTSSMEIVSGYDIKKTYIDQNPTNEPEEYISILDRY